MVEGEGFEPSKAEPSDLQSDPFDRSGTPPLRYKSAIMICLAECVNKLKQKHYTKGMLVPAQSAVSALDAFLTRPLATTLARHETVSPHATALAQFHAAAAEVPAYRDFLQKQAIDPTKVQDFAAFQALPLMTKANYMRAYPLPARCRHGRLADCEMVAVSSGSTGASMFWPRSLAHELDVTTRFEQVFDGSFNAMQHTTLVVICFALGTWVGGMYTTACCRYLAQKGYALSVVTPGNNKAEIYRVVTELAGYFDQTVLIGYPPFIKDVIDTGIAQDIEWSRHSIKMMFAGEVFSEEWRSLVCNRVGADNPAYDTASLYGTADAGVLGNETPLSITLRRFFANTPEAARALFGESRLPTLLQYDPLSRFFEVHEGTLVVTGDNGVPLLRYHIADQGGIISYAAMLDFMREWPLPAEAEALLFANNCHLPFVYLFGRADFTVSYFGANIYPENITVGLEQPEITEWVTGKFVLEVKENADQNKRLCVTVELLPNVDDTTERRTAIAASIHAQLLRLNSEFAHYVPAEYQQPEIFLLPAGDASYFPVGVKHRYTRKTS